MTSPSPKKRSYDIWVLLGLLGFGLLLRGSFIASHFQDLQTDPDSYLGIAQNLAAGRGFSIPETSTPTAFRPPLYPLLLTPFSGEQVWGRAALNLIASAGAIWFLWRTGFHLGLNLAGRSLSTLLYCIDPLLVRYSSLPMTESVCSFLTALLIWQLTRPGGKCWSDNLDADSRRESASVIDAMTGAFLGFCVLTRPTYWVFAVLFGAYTAWKCRNRSRIENWNITKRLLVSGCGLAIIISPWVLRNAFALGTPILMTTHGGYTILLGNNEAFYKEVVEQPWGTVWDGQHGPGQAVWADGINQQMDREELHTEVARDRWMGNLAKRTIRENPYLFVRACLLRFVRFWNIVPSGPAGDSISETLKTGIGTFYLILWLLVLMGSVNVLRLPANLRQSWMPLFLLIAAFTLLHLVYWSNVRMRAPIVPALTLLAGAFHQRLLINKPHSTNSDR